MNRYLLPFIIASLSLAGALRATEKAAPAPTSEAEQAIWSLERSYWKFVEKNDLTAYSNQGHENFLGWPSVSATPVGKDHITDWITSQTGQGMTFKVVGFEPAALKVTGEVASACYRISFQWVNREGDGETRTLRIMHAWLRAGSDWRIIGGMSMPEVKVAAK